MATVDDLKEAFAGESQANRRYLAFAKKAEEDGFPQVARLFRAIAEAETIHAHSHLRAMNGVGSTEENLRAAIAGEAYEFQEMYPAFLAEAQREASRTAEVSFRRALAVEETHHGLYTQALEAVSGGKDLAQAAVFVCEVCGHTAVGEAPDRCPVCGAPKARFREVL